MSSAVVRSKYRTLKRSLFSNLDSPTTLFTAKACYSQDKIGISRGVIEIVKELNKKLPESLIMRARPEPDGFTAKYIPWYTLIRIVNLHAPKWSGKVRSITHSPDGKTVSVVYRVTIYGTETEIYRESTGTAKVDQPGNGDPVLKAEEMAFRRACTRFGLGLYLYNEE